jgi:hypothetical protein
MAGPDEFNSSPVTVVMKIPSSQVIIGFAVFRKTLPKI